MQTRQEILEAVCALTTTDLRALGKALQEQYGPDAVLLLFGDATDTAVEEAAQTESAAELFNLVLLDAGPKKLNIIKLIFETKRSGLKEAKDIADFTPSVICSKVSADVAQQLRKRFAEEGAVVEIQKLR